MSRLSHYNARISMLESQLEKLTADSLSADGITKQGPSRESLERELEQLYRRRDRLEGRGPVAQGRVGGLGRRY